MTRFKISITEFHDLLDRFTNYWAKSNTRASRIYTTVGQAVSFAVFRDIDPMTWDYDNICNRYLTPTITMWENMAESDPDSMFTKQDCLDRATAFRAIKGMLSDEI